MRVSTITRGTIESTLALASFHLWLVNLDGLDPRLATQGAVAASFLASMWLAWRAVGARGIAKVAAFLVLIAPSLILDFYFPGYDGRFIGFVVLAGAGLSLTSIALAANSKWNRLRSRSLIWELTHAQLRVIAIFLALFILVWTFRQADSSWVQRHAAGLPAEAAFAVRIVAGALPFAIVAIGGAAIVLPLLLPLAFAFAWLAARGMTRRVEELLAVESMAKARRSLFARVAHELKNPLAALRAAIDGIRNRGIVAPEVEVLDLGVGRLTRLVGDLTELARAEVGLPALEIESVDLERAIESALCAEYARAESAGIALVVEIDEDTPRRPLDRLRFEQIVTNLVQNALRHVPSGGIVRVRAFPEQNGATVIVEDTGEGIDASIQSRIFEPGFSKDGSLGLGLAIASELTTRMNGTLTVESPSGLGARFVLRI